MEFDKAHALCAETEIEMPRPGKLRFRVFEEPKGAPHVGPVQTRGLTHDASGG